MGEQGETERDVSRVEVVDEESSDGDRGESNVKVGENMALVVVQQFAGSKAVTQTRSWQDRELATVVWRERVAISGLR